MKPVIGTDLKPYRVEAVNPESMKVWAVFLRDPNPIHLDPGAVKAKGLGERVINQGPANLAYVISMLQAAYPGAALETLDLRYVDNVFAGDAVEAGGTVRELSEHAVGTRMHCDVWLRADERSAVMTGNAVLLLPN